MVAHRKSLEQRMQEDRIRASKVGSLRAWKDNYLVPAFDALTTRLQELDLAVDVEREVIKCPLDNKPISKNYFRLLMRNEIPEYLSELSGKQKQIILDKLYEGFVGGSIQCAKNPENASNLLSEEEYANAYRQTYGSAQDTTG